MMILKTGYWPLASGCWSLAARLWICQQQACDELSRVEASSKLMKKLLQH
jgi:hypothetical protein